MPPTPLSYHHILCENLAASSQAFYHDVESTLPERDLPGARFSRVCFSEGGVLCPLREYLRIRRKDLTFYVCSAPWGTGHFFSWRLVRRATPASLARAIGCLVRGRELYYRVDAENAFRKSVHAAITKVIRVTRSGQGLRSLGPRPPAGDLRNLQTWRLSQTSSGIRKGGPIGSCT